MYTVINTPEQWYEIAEGIAAEYGLPPGLASAVVKQESGGNPHALSPKGAYGLGQLRPKTAKDLGVDRNNPWQNLEGMVKYLAQNYEEFGDWRQAIQAYTAHLQNLRQVA